MQIRPIIRIVFLLLLQFFVISPLELWGICHPFIYVYILLFLPFKWSVTQDMLFGAALGLVVDMFYNSPGVHLATCILIMFLRRNIVIDNLDAYERSENFITSNAVNKNVFRRYVSVLVVIHHFFIFLMDVGNFYHFGKMILQLSFSCLFSILFILFYDHNISKQKVANSL